MRWLPLLLLAACSQEPEYEPPSYDIAAQGPWYACPDLSTTTDVLERVPVFTAEPSFFGNLDSDPDDALNRREIEATVELPAGEYAQVGLWLQLDCPDSGLCDHWDRSASLQVRPADDEDGWIELDRYITAYRLPTCHFIDLTPLANTLQGPMVFRNWIDTWVGPGHAEGEGWNVTAELVYWPGEDAGAATVRSVYGGRQSLTVGESTPSVDEQTTPVLLDVPADATRVEAHLITTGHSFGNTDNCAEFCEMDHHLLVDGEVFVSNPWRDDCRDNPVRDQFGTWRHPRNGWCPGATAVGEVFDLSDVVEPGTSVELDLDVVLAGGEPYVNEDPVDLLPYTMYSVKVYAW